MRLADPKENDDMYEVDFTWGDPEAEMKPIEDDLVEDDQLEALLSEQIDHRKQLRMKMRITVKQSAPKTDENDQQPPMFCVEFSSDEGDSFRLATAFKEITTSVLFFAVDELPAQ